MDEGGTSLAHEAAMNGHSEIITVLGEATGEMLKDVLDTFAKPEEELGWT